MIPHPQKKRICLVTPSLSGGGMERVMSQLAEYFSRQESLQISLVSITKSKITYDLPPSVCFCEPKFEMKKHTRFISLIKTFIFLHKQVRLLKPHFLLSFGGKYNSFVILATLGFPVHIYISERSRPSISYGRLLDILNPLIYKKSSGIIAQTNQAQKVIYEKTGHPRIRVIANPLTINKPPIVQKENIILNVGRFIPSKGQMELLNIFRSINSPDWKLIFVGDGPELENIRGETEKLGTNLKVEFAGFVKDVNKYYYKSRIFAFTSASEGFPNSLAEAMASGMACITYDCEAGPSELIDDCRNGFLVKLHDTKEFQKKLKLLMKDEELQKEFGSAAFEKAKDFDINLIGREYLDFIVGENHESNN
jgi:GalNAc-alpha-(1->4)-GalNAc-alpha-(1->3)-diNAcBac-PP-undecaprenol alpha-1,4-N-acetyl-D-galactosaminyltransferase